MTSSSETQFATVNLSGVAAEVVRSIMRRTGWSVDQALACVFVGVDASCYIGQSAVEGNTVGVQVVKNTITPHPFKINDLVEVKVLDLDEVGITLYGRITGFAPQGPEVEISNRSMAAAEAFDLEVCKQDIWSYEDLKLI